MNTVARLTLAKARFFVDQAAKATPNERDAFCNYLEAAIVFARSVTSHLQKEFAERPGFDAWYAMQQRSLGESRLAKFLLERRNYILKEGPVPIRRIVDMTLTESVAVSSSVTVKVIRGAPWFRRSPRILFYDAIYPLRNRLHSIRQRRAQLRAKASRPQSDHSPSLTRDEIYFSDPEWAAVPAIELLQRQLDEVAVIVLEAERKFSSR